MEEPSDWGTWCTPAKSVAVYETSSPVQVAWILRDSGAAAAFVEDQGRARVVAEAAVASAGQVIARPRSAPTALFVPCDRDCPHGRRQ
jgi:long-subunit acyl-CoA synthetase (AMP-forming)